MVALLFLACGPGPEPSTPPVGTSSPCRTGTFGAAGGVVEVGGASLEIPAGALADGVSVELCQDGDEWTVGPEDLSFTGPLWIELPHHDIGEVTSRLFVPVAGEAHLFDPDATRPVPGWIRSALWYPGVVWVAEDLRTVVPFVDRPVTDLLFVVDDSCSMGNEQGQLAVSFEGVWPQLVDLGVDFHVGVVSTDVDVPMQGGILISTPEGDGWIDPMTLDPHGAFTAMVDLGVDGSGSERGLEASYLAVDVQGPTTNAGFFRPDANLIVVVVSDEDDQSRVSVIGSPSLYADWLWTLRSPPARAVFDGIISPAGEIGDSPYSGTAYHEVIDEVRGVSVDIRDDDWTAFADAVVAQAQGRGVLALPPIVGPPAVWTFPEGAPPRWVHTWSDVYLADVGTLTVEEEATEGLFAVYLEP